jgi:uncharacterized protein YcaQ
MPPRSARSPAPIAPAPARPVVSPDAVRALFLERQHLLHPRARRLTPRGLIRFVEDVGGLQLDSINVLERAHYLTTWSRFGPYERARLDRLVYRRRLLFEYWAHAACLVPVSSLSWWRRAMLDYKGRHTGWSTWLKRNTRLIQEVTAAIGRNGPMSHGDFERGVRRKGRGGWWSWKPVQHALHHLWMTGVVAIHGRQHFQKRYDLLERAFPDAPTDAASVEAFQRWHVERSLHAMGAATDQDLAGYLTFPRFFAKARRAGLRALLEAGEATEIEVEGTRGRWLVLTRDLPALKRAQRRAPAASGTTLLSPFDSLLWYRGRVARLFGFDYRIEVYTPQTERVHGYYTLPILHHGQLVGRVDAKTHRGEGRLEVRHVHVERWAATGSPPPVGHGPRLELDALLGGVGDALVSLGRFVGAEQVVLRRVTPGRLRAPLAQALRGAARSFT